MISAKRLTHLFVSLAATCLLAGNAAAHTQDCTPMKGIQKARCERHDKMFAKCGQVKGEAHYVCDREFLLANPLACDALSGEDRDRCAAEGKAFKACEAKAGREFITCVRDSLKASPM